MPILILMITLGTIFSLVIFSLFHQFSDSQIKERKTQFESDILEMINTSYDKLVETREAASTGSVFLHKAKTVSLIELYCKRNKLQGKISENGKQLYLIENTHQVNESAKAVSWLARSLYPVDYDSHVFFNPWKWEVSVYQSDASYREFMGKATHVFIGLIIVFIFANLILMVIFNLIIAKPLGEIIAPLRDGQMPAYTGINEFEFLSKSICRDITGRIQAENEIIKGSVPFKCGN